MELRQLESLEQWLESTTHGKTPNGKSTEVIIVPDGGIINVLQAGWQHSGSGGYDGSSASIGVVNFISNLPERRDSAICQVFAKYQMSAPSVVHQTESDCINNVRYWRKTYICASEEDISMAVLKLGNVRQKEARNGDLQYLKSVIISKFRDENEHIRAYHHNGCCHAGSDAADMHAVYDTSIEELAVKGKIDEALLAGEPTDFQNAIRKLASISEKKRKSFWKNCQDTYNAETKSEGRKFAQKQLVAVVKKFSITYKQAKAVMRLSRPSQLLRCFEEAKKLEGLVLEKGCKTRLERVFLKIRKSYCQDSEKLKNVDIAITHIHQGDMITTAVQAISAIIKNDDFDNRPVIWGLLRIINLDYDAGTCGQLISFIHGLVEAIEQLS